MTIVITVTSYKRQQVVLVDFVCARMRAGRKCLLFSPTFWGLSSKFLYFPLLLFLLKGYTPIQFHLDISGSIFGDDCVFSHSHTEQLGRPTGCRDAILVSPVSDLALVKFVLVTSLMNWTKSPLPLMRVKIAIVAETLRLKITSRAVEPYQTHIEHVKDAMRSAWSQYCAYCSRSVYYHPWQGRNRLPVQCPQVHWPAPRNPMVIRLTQLFSPWVCGCRGNASNCYWQIPATASYIYCSSVDKSVQTLTHRAIHV